MAGQTAAATVARGVQTVDGFLLAQMATGALLSQQAVGRRVGEMRQVVVPWTVDPLAEGFPRGGHHPRAGVHETMRDAVHLVGMAAAAHLRRTVHVSRKGNHAMVGIGFRYRARVPCVAKCAVMGETNMRG